MRFLPIGQVNNLEKRKVMSETDWEKRYIEKDTPWDKGEPAPGLVDWLKNQNLNSGTLEQPGGALELTENAWCWHV